MASISSTNSSTSLGNTSLRGFGGMASGIDRDSIIEQMTLKTTTKINNQKKKLTELEWKQEAYREVSNKILDWSDKYTSYSSSSNLKDPWAFAKNQITVHGKDESTSFITATGTSQMLDNVSILGVGQLATSTVRRSEKHTTDSIQTSLKNMEQTYKFSNLNGAKITFATWNNTDGKKGFENAVTLEFRSTYTREVDDGNGGKKTETVTMDYLTDDPTKLVEQLNDYLKNSELKLGETKIGDALKFEYDSVNDKMMLVDRSTLSDSEHGAGMGGYVIRDGSALSALGYKAGEGGYADDGISIDEFNNHLTSFKESYRREPTALNYLKDQKLTFNYDGSQKSVTLLTSDEAAEIEAMKVEVELSTGKSEMTMKELNEKLKDTTLSEADKNKLEAAKESLINSQNEKVASNLQTRLNQAYGTDMVKVSFYDKDNNFVGLNFVTQNSESTLSITSNDTDLLTNLGLEYGSSNKVNLNGKLTQDALLGENYRGLTVTKPDSDVLDLKINGVEITGLTAKSSISDILSKINSTSEAGVKATYVSATGEFMLVSSETGTGREINLDSDLAKALFGQYEKEADGQFTITDGKMVSQTEIKDGKTVEKGLTSGQNAKIYVSYGDGEPVLLDRASNTFNLEGLNVTVSGTFGLKENADLNNISAGSFDTSRSVTFTAKADVDGAVEKVKTFFEEFNEIATMVGSQVRTRPDSKYGALTDEQKEEMDETSIENWEKKAKQGILYGDSTMQDLSGAIEGIFSRLMESGASYDDLKEIGITYSEDYLDGGTLVFDEAKFRDAMESNPEKVSNIFTGGGNVRKGLVDVIDETFTPYATKYASKNGGDSYGRLIDIAGSEKKPITLNTNQIYKQLKEMQETIDKLQEQLQVEQDRYISQFTTMETLLNQMNTQQSYLSQLTG